MSKNEYYKYVKRCNMATSLAIVPPKLLPCKTLFHSNNNNKNRTNLYIKKEKKQITIESRVLQYHIEEFQLLLNSHKLRQHA